MVLSFTPVWKLVPGLVALAAIGLVVAGYTRLGLAVLGSLVLLGVVGLVLLLLFQEDPGPPPRDED